MSRSEATMESRDPEYAKRVGAEIARIRRRLGMTQADMAAALGSDSLQPHVSKWERGLIVPQVESLSRIAKIGGVPMSIFDVEEPQKTVSEADLAEAKELLRRAMELLGGSDAF